MNNKPRMQIQFPSLLLIPVLSLIGSIIKLFGLTNYDWLNVIILVPVVTYFLMCVGYCVLAILGLMMIKLFSKN